MGALHHKATYTAHGEELGFVDGEGIDVKRPLVKCEIFGRLYLRVSTEARETRREWEPGGASLAGGSQMLGVSGLGRRDGGGCVEDGVEATNTKF